MKKFVLIAVAALVVLALGVNWYYTREIRQSLDRMARTVSMFGTLTYDSVRLSPAGEIHINELDFRPRGGDLPAVSVAQIAFRTGSLPALFTLQDRIESGQLPEELGIRIEGFEMSLTAAASGLGSGLMPAGARSRAGGADHSPAAGAMFAAAGCGGRRTFSLDDFADMGYLRVDADTEAHYRIIDQGRRVRLSYRIRYRDAGEIAFETTLDLMAGSLSAMEVMDAARRADLRSFSLAYLDLGFFERMMDFCAGKTGLSRDEYIDHHIERWQQRWIALGARPDAELVDAYRTFVTRPEHLRLETRSDYTVSLEGIGLYSLPAFLERMDAALTVNYGQPVAVALEEIESAGTEAGSPAPEPERPAPTPAEPAETTPTEPGDARETSPDTDMTRPVEPPSGETGEAGDADDESARPARGWQPVDASGLGAYIDRRIGVDMRSGRRFEGRLARTDADAIHIRIQSVGGYYVRPLARADIEAVSVWND